MTIVLNCMLHKEYNSQSFCNQSQNTILPVTTIITIATTANDFILIVFINNVLTHPVFAVFERLVAGRICEIVISGNFSDSNIQRHKDFIYRIQTKLEELMKYRLCAFERFTMEQKNIIDEDLNLTGHDRKELEKNLAEHINFVKEINEKIFSLLKTSLMDLTY